MIGTKEPDIFEGVVVVEKRPRHQRDLEQVFKKHMGSPKTEEEREEALQEAFKKFRKGKAKPGIKPGGTEPAGPVGYSGMDGYIRLAGAIVRGMVRIIEACARQGDNASASLRAHAAYMEQLLRGPYSILLLGVDPEYVIKNAKEV